MVDDADTVASPAPEPANTLTIFDPPTSLLTGRVVSLFVRSPFVRLLARGVGGSSRSLFAPTALGPVSALEAEHVTVTRPWRIRP